MVWLDWVEIVVIYDEVVWFFLIEIKILLVVVFKDYV